MQFCPYLTVLTIAVLIGWTTSSHANQHKTYDLSGFTGLSASAAVDVELTQGDAFRVEAYADSGDFSGLELRVKDGVLIATRPEEIWKNKRRSIRRTNGRRVIKINGVRVPTYTVRVTAPRIDHLGASSSSIVTARGIKTSDLSIKASSSGDINAEVTGGDVSVDASSSGDVVLSGTYDNLDIDAGSSGDVVVSGTCDRLDIKASSSGDVKADALTAQHLKLQATSSGDIRAKASGGDVSVNASSSGDVVLSGTCDKLDIKASSNADVKANNLTAQHLDLLSTSSGNIRAKVAGGNVSVNATTRGDVILSGTCDKLDVKASSGADVKAGNLTCQNGNLRASSGADIIAMLTETVTAHASSGGDILVRGGAKPVKVTKSSGGDISIRN